MEKSKEHWRLVCERKIRRAGGYDVWTNLFQLVRYRQFSKHRQTLKLHNISSQIVQDMVELCLNGTRTRANYLQTTPTLRRGYWRSHEHRLTVLRYNAVPASALQHDDAGRLNPLPCETSLFWKCDTKSLNTWTLWNSAASSHCKTKIKINVTFSSRGGMK